MPKHLQAYRDAQGGLVIELDGDGRSVTLRFKNAAGKMAVELPDSVAAEWGENHDTLKLAPCHRLTVRISQK